MTGPSVTIAHHTRQYGHDNKTEAKHSGGNCASHTSARPSMQTSHCTNPALPHFLCFPAGLGSNGLRHSMLVRIPVAGLDRTAHIRHSIHDDDALRNPARSR